MIAFALVLLFNTRCTPDDEGTFLGSVMLLKGCPKMVR